MVLGVATFLVWAGESLFEWFLGVAWRGVAQDVQHHARMDAFANVELGSVGWFEDRSTGRLMSVLSDDVNQLERFLDGGANDLVQLAVTGIAVSTAFFVISPAIAWWAMLPVPLVIVGSLWFQKRLEPRYAEVRTRVGDLNARLSEHAREQPA